MYPILSIYLMKLSSSPAYWSALLILRPWPRLRATRTQPDSICVIPGLQQVHVQSVSTQQPIYRRPLSCVPQASLALLIANSCKSGNMAMDGAFRKINIDLLEEDVLLPSDLYDPDPRGVDGVLADAKNRSGEVRGLVSK